eukprot:9561290-Karenia_brevis.AAC.1
MQGLSVCCMRLAVGQAQVKVRSMAHRKQGAQSDAAVKRAETASSTKWCPETMAPYLASL